MNKLLLRFLQKTYWKQDEDIGEQIEKEEDQFNERENPDCR